MSSDRGTAYRVRGVLLPEEEPAELWIDGSGRLVEGPVAEATTLADGGWIVPGLVDAHCHIGLGVGGPVELPEAVVQAETDRDAGTLLIRDCGSPLDTTPLQSRDDLPVIIRAARHVARPKRYIRDLAVELDDPALLADEVAAQAAAGDGWVKLVGDWIDRGVGDLAPLWSDEELVEAIEVAHAAGARVTAHVFGTDALPGLINAGIDCIEHGTGLTDDLIGEMVRRGTALVPTLINARENFLDIAASAEKFPAYAAHMRELHAGSYDVVRRAMEAGVAVYAGTDAGGMIAHGRLADEVAELHTAGMSGTAALGAASWAARSWLGHPGLSVGERADLVVYAEDPRDDVRVLRSPELVVLRGRPVRRAH
ncbi:MAG TPA: amidohydrolase family protein [Pseudonocardia sp.]|nr:amidohydrolase family protein [Pseudonocardia sp.]